MKYNAFFMFFAAVLPCAVVTPAVAQEAASSPDTIAMGPDNSGTDPVDLGRDSITIGAGGVYVPSYEGSNDYRLMPAGAVRGELHHFKFFTRGTRLYVDAIPDPGGPTWDFELGPVVSVNLNRTGNLVDPRMEALGTRKLALEVGGYAGIRKTGVLTSDYDSLSFRIAYVHDISGVNDSYLITPTIDYGTPLSRKFYVGVSVSADYAGTNYARTYFDVDAAGSLRSGLPVFNARGGWKDVVFGVLGDYALTGDLTHGLGLFVVASYSRLENDFAASPVTSIAGSPDQLFGAVGLGYTF